MIKVLNYFFSFLRIVAYLGAFGLTLFIIVNMNNRLGKPITDSIMTFLPFILLLIVFSVNILFSQKQITSNLFYNLTSSVVFLVVVLVAYRAISDDNMILKSVFSQEINFNFFADFINPMLVLLYGLFITNVILMFTKKEEVVKAS